MTGQMKWDGQACVCGGGGALVCAELMCVQVRQQEREGSREDTHTRVYFLSPTHTRCYFWPEPLESRKQKTE